jgi:hypothetical protein
MGFIIFPFSIWVGFQAFEAYSVSAGFWTFFGTATVLWAIYYYIKGSMAAERASPTNGLVFTMEEGVDLLQKAVYLQIHGALPASVTNRIEQDLGKSKIRGARPLRENELVPPIKKLDLTYADAAMRTLFKSRLLYPGEAEQIEAIMEPKLDTLRDEFTGLEPDDDSYEASVNRAYEMLK